MTEKVEGSKKSPLGIALRGTLMGTADVIPGVSGGTVALVTGIYRDLLTAIARWTPSRLLRILRELLQGRISHLGQYFKDLHLDFLLPLGLGIVLAGVIASRIIPDLLTRFPIHVHAFFFGLVLASIYVPWSHVKKASWSGWAAALLSAGLGFWLTGLADKLENPGAIHLFFGGAIAISAMILPGLSGSFLLKAAGLYEVVLAAIRDVTSFDMAGLPFLMAFGMGILVGLPLFVRLLNGLLARAHDATMMALSGLMLGALRSLWPLNPAIDTGAPLGTTGVVIWVGCGITLLVVLLFAERQLRSRS